jgi:hypothetical protein
MVRRYENPGYLQQLVATHPTVSIRVSHPLNLWCVAMRIQAIYSNWSRRTLQSHQGVANPDLVLDPDLNLTL